MGFSNGCALLALKKPPPLVPNSLMISCEATGPCAMVCSVTVSITGLPSGIDDRFAVSAELRHLLRLDQLDGVVGLQVLHHALRNQHQRADNAERQQHPQVARTMSTQKLPMVSICAARDAANEGDGQRDADRRRHEVVIREAGHLREVAHRGFAASSSASWCWW